MARSCFGAKTLDDLMRPVFEEIISNGEDVVASRGPNREIVGVRLEIAQPRARLSRTETRGKPFSCLGELLWYLSQSDEADAIAYYINRYEEEAEDGKVHGAYGTRLFCFRGIDQIKTVAELLRNRPSSRQAVVQIFDGSDLADGHRHVPCTCTLQFLIRSDQLHLIAHMRSNDAYLGLPHDVFCFTMLQELVARDLGVELGVYRHLVGSLHIYQPAFERAHQFVAEGWQSTVASTMPAMPRSSPWPAVALVLQAEKAIRTGASFDDAKLDAVDSYWADLVRLLQVYRCHKDQNLEGIAHIRNRMSCKLYYPFIDRLMR